jgi:threonine/homoserine/homoserine lactone efflux protein
MVIAVPAGPVGVLCVRRTFFEGARFGIVSGLGAAVADVIFGIIAGLGLTVVRDWLLGYQDWFGVLGGVYLVIVGTRTIRSRSNADPQPLGARSSRQRLPRPSRSPSPIPSPFSPSPRSSRRWASTTTAA